MSETRFTADNARDILYARQDVFDRTLAIIRGIVDTQIRDAARAGKHSLTLTVPPSVFGREPYDLATMGKALARQLYEDQYEVTGTCARLVVSWSSRPAPDPGEAINVKADKKHRRKLQIDVPTPSSKKR